MGSKVMTEGKKAGLCEIQANNLGFSTPIALPVEPRAQLERLMISQLMGQREAYRMQQTDKTVPCVILL